MITKNKIEFYSSNNYTTKDILNETNYTLSQIRYACKKYNVKLLTNKKKFNVDKNKVKLLLENNFSINEIATILKVNKRCIYNILYRNNWSKKRNYVKSKKDYSYRFGINIDPNYIIKVTYANGQTSETNFKELFGSNIKKIFITDKSL